MNSNKIGLIINRLKPLINKIAYKNSNSHLEPDDVKSEIYLKLVEFYNKNKDQFEEMSIDDVVIQSVTVIKNFSVDLIRYSVKRADTSVYTTRVEDVIVDPQVEYSLSVKDSQVSETVVNEVKEYVLKKLDPDSVKFFNEAIQPSEETIKYYLNWKENEAGTHVNAPGIPPRVLGRALGFDGAKVSRIQRKIAKALLECGFTLYEIFGWKFCSGQSEAWYSSYGVQKSKV